MNKIFRIVWSHATQSWVVVSELTKAHKKQSSSNVQKSAVKFSGNFIKSSAIALSLLSGHSAYAALNDAGTGNGAVAWGTDSKTTAGDSVAIGKGPLASGSYAVAIGASATAGRTNAVAMGNQATATGDNATALGRGAKAERNDTVAVGNSAEAKSNEAVAIGVNSKATADRAVALGRASKAERNDTVAVGNSAEATSNEAVAIGLNSKATADRTIALGQNTKAGANEAVAIGTGANAGNQRSIAIGKTATIVNGDDTIAIGTESKVQGNTTIVIGKNAKTTNNAEGTIVIGRDAFSEGSGNTGRPNTVVGRGAYTAFGQNGEYRLNASTALGFQAGAGVIVDPNNNRKLVKNETNADTNAEVLVKAGFGLDGKAPAETKASLQAGAVNNNLVFYRKNHINEGTAVGVEARAVGDQSIAIGGQVVAGDGVIALGGNDTDALRDNKYQVVTDDAVRRTNVSTVDDYNLAYTESANTVAGQYNKLVGRGMPTGYKSTYGQSGSVVIGMEAHSTTALGTAIGTNSVVRMGAFGATAIGAGSTVQPNAEAAVAIGMGSVANGAYALAAGTASWAELGDIAMGYKAQASGKQGAIAIGQSTNAKGDSSVMIGGANISNAADQATTYEAERKNPDGSRVTYTKNVTERINGQNVTRKYTYVSTETKNGTVADAYAELTGKTMNTASLDYNDPKNRNGHASTSIGVHSLAKGDLASAYGASSRASAIGSLALGTGAIADKQNAVAIGTGSTTDLTGTRQLDASYDKEGKWVASDSPNAAYTFKWAGGVNTSEGDVVSFGSSGAERQLKNVAAGRIAEDSTDAINGSQVNAVIEKFIADGVKYFSVNSTVEPNRQNKGATGKDAIAIGPNASATKVDAVATGNGATATGDRATAYGAGTTATAANAVAVGSTVTVTEGTTTKEVATKADAASATALGAGAQATAMNSTAVGTLSEAKEAEAIAIGSKAKSESVAGVAIGQNAQVGADATQGLALGQNTAVSTVGGVALGTGSVASVAGGVSGIGVDGEAEGTARVNKYAKLHDNADNALTSGQGAVAIGGTSNNTPFTRQITGLAAGTNDTDAVNVAQLKSVNLAFKGNTGTGDVRLHDQRLTVESDNTNLLTVTASDKKLTLTPKTTSLTVDSTLGKVTVPDATNNGLITAADVANAINAAHWNVATEASTATGAKHTGDSNKAVHAGETVKFIAGEHVTIDQNGHDITISMKDAVTNIMVKDQIQSSFENGDNTTFSVNPVTGKLRYDVNPKATYTTVQTGNTVMKDGAVTNLKDHLPADAITSGTKPVLDEINKEGNQAATVNDVLNAGWNLQNNDVAKDFVKPYDTVNFADGMNTSAVVTVSADGKTSSVRYNVTGLPITYTTEAGAPVSKVGDRFYTVGEDGIPVGPTGNKAVAKNANGDLVDAQGNVIAQIDPSKTPLKTNLVNPNVENTTGAPNTRSTTPTQLGNVANGGVTHNLRDADGTELALANDGKYYDATKVNPDGSLMAGVTDADAKTPVVLANDGKWYPKDKVSDRGELKDPTATPVVPGITAAAPTAGLVNFDKSNPNNAATIGDLRNIGWVVSAPTNGYLDQVRNANQVDFVGKNGVVVTGETKNGIRTITVETAEEAVVFKGPDGTSLIKTEKGYVPENSVKIDGNYYPPNTTKDPVTGNIVNNGAPATPVTPVPKEDVVTSMNSNTPKTLNNVKNTLPNVNDETKTITTPDGQEQPNAGDVSNINRAPLTAAQAAELSNPKTAAGQPNPNYKGSNAATVSDVLNAGWNLQTNGTALDFVKPYDTVNFADGGNTTVVSSTDGTTSKIQVNVTGLPVSNTITDANGNQVPVTKVGNTYFPVKADGTPDIQRDADGNPTNGYTIADNGNIYPSDQLDFVEQPDGTKTVTPRAGANPTTINTNLANPNVPNGNPTKGVNTPTPLGNVANGANTHNPISTTGTPLKQAKDGKWYDATKVDDQGNKLPDADNFEGTPAVLANDGKWYEAGKVDAKGTPAADAQPISNPLTNKTANGGLINFANSNPNNAATVGDLQNMGWIVGAPGNNYADQVRNANQVNFVGKNLATVTGETDANGIRTITVDVQAQKTVETAHTPVVYTDSKGDKLTKLDNGKFYDANAVKALGNNITEVDGKLYPADAVKVGDKYYPAGTVLIDGTPYPQGSEKGPDGVIRNPKGLDLTEIKGLEPVTDAKASMNNTDGSTTNPFPLANVGSNLKQVVDPKENVLGQVNDKDGETKVGDKTNTAPYTAKDAANLVQKYELNDDGTVKTETVPVIDPETGKQKLDEAGNPVTEEKKVLNPNYIGNNAATVSDVLNAGWNLQNNGEARDFVKPYDTVNFVNGANTTAVVTTNAEGTGSDVTYNVTGLPVTYTTAEGKLVSKVGDKFYTVNEKGQPITTDGKPAVKTNAEGKPVTEDGIVIEPINTTENPLQSNLVNPNVANTADAPNKQTTTPTQLGNVANGAKTFKPVDGKVLANDGNWYPADKVEANGKPKDGATPVANPLAPKNAAGDVLAKGNDGKWYKEADLTDGKPNDGAQVQDLAPKAENADKAGLVNFANSNPNNAATVGDLQNLGFVVSAKDNGYTDQVRNANKVEFKGSNGIEVTGKTLKDGTREITVAIADGKVTDKVTITKDGKNIPAVKIGDNYYEVDKNGKPVGYEVDENGKPTANNKPIDVAGATITNEGNKVVTGNTVATAIQESGWNVGLADASKANAAFSDKDKALSANKLEKINPNDNVRFADGKGTKAAVATVERVDEFGKKVTDTYVKFDVDAGEITADATKPGMVKGSVTADEAKKLTDDLKKAEQAVKDLPADATPEAKKTAQDALKAAQDAAAPLNKVVTAQNVVEAINNSGWRTNSTTATGGAKDTLINPGKAVNFESGKNMEVAQTVDKNGNVTYTYATKDDVQFNSVQFGDANGPKITNKGGNINISGPDGKAPTKITGVAAGDISPNSTDAVNGAQIYALVGDQSNVNQTSPTYTKVDLDENGKPSYTTVNAPAGKTVVTAKDDNGHDIPVLKTYNVHSQKEIVTNSVVEAIYNMNEQGIKFFHSNDGVERPKQEQDNNFDSSARGKFATAIGSRSKADGTNAVAIGFNSVVTGNDSISIGTGNRVTGNNAGAFGDLSTVSGQASYSVGNNNTVATNDTFVLGNDVKYTVENSVILGAKSTATAGDGSRTASLYNIKQDGTKGASTTAGSTGTVSTATVGHMTYGGFQGAKADGVVSVGAAGNERRIQNVAAGEISSTSTDAINGSQLYSVASNVGSRINNLQGQVNKLGKRMNAGVAGAMAAANLMQPHRPGQSAAMVAIGQHQGQAALAVGYSRISDNGKYGVKLSLGANSQGQVSTGAGMSYFW